MFLRGVILFFLFLYVSVVIVCAHVHSETSENDVNPAQKQERTSTYLELLGKTTKNPISYCGQTPCRIPPSFCCGKYKESCCTHTEIHKGTPGWAWIIVAVVVVGIAGVVGGYFYWRHRRRAYNRL